MKRTFFIVLAIWFAAPATVEAHLMNTGLGPFYDGLAHLFVSPEDLLPVIALALLAGLRGPRSGRAVLLVLPVAWLVGCLVGQWTAIALCPPALSAVLTFTLGALVAADFAVPLPLLVVATTVLGFLQGGANGAEFAGQHTASLTSVGIVVSIFVVTSLVAGQIATVRAATPRIVVRVAGSWIAAIAMLMFGWVMRG
jgi:urease accessory protein